MCAESLRDPVWKYSSDKHSDSKIYCSLHYAKLFITSQVPFKYQRILL
jgi:hypothetical protein